MLYDTMVIERGAGRRLNYILIFNSASSLEERPRSLIIHADTQLLTYTHSQRGGFTLKYMTNRLATEIMTFKQ